ncbi:SDR family oxidoreductase [Leifsonia poae]|uniref:SDR family oxidoreductase n=1 Tax=Leifsonia poae TaxID=110933 RepID=UPI001CBE60B3|nr:NmrA family NAD(P)-binding protein [Leifsonia poae]
MIVVTAANGNQGRHLIPRLLDAGHEVRAVVASAESVRALLEAGVQDVLAEDLGDERSWPRIVDGASAIYHVGPTLHPRERAMGVGLIDAAVRAGVEHFVFSSVLHSIITGLVQHVIKRDIEEHLVTSGLEFTILQPANYMLPLKLVPVFERDVFELSWSLERTQSLVDLGDVAEVAEAVLVDPVAHAGATYELVAPGRYTAFELGGILSEALGRLITVHEIDPDSYLRAWVGDADPATVSHELSVLRGITSTYSAHDFIGNPNVLTWLLGRPPTTFRQFVDRTAAALESERGAR